MSPATGTDRSARSRIAAGKLHRVTNDLNSYSNLTLGSHQRWQAIAGGADHAGGRDLHHEFGRGLGSAVATEVDDHGDIGVGWLPDGRLATLDYDGHISIMNADGSNRNVVYQEHLPMQGLSVCPDGTHALFSMPNAIRKAR